MQPEVTTGTEQVQISGNVASGVLVLSIHNFDDIPLALFQDWDSAMEFAGKANPADENPLGSFDTTGHLGFKVVEFINGKPERCKIVRWID